MNTGASWLGPIEAESRVLAMQTKLNQWGQALQRYEHMESRMR